MTDLKGYDRSFGREPEEQATAEDNTLKILIIGLVVVAIVLALI